MLARACVCSAMQAGGGVHVSGVGSSAGLPASTGVRLWRLPVPLLHSYAGQALGPGAASLSPNLTITPQNHLDVMKPNQYLICRTQCNKKMSGSVFRHY